MDLIAQALWRKASIILFLTAVNTFFSSRRRLLKDIGSLLNTELCTSLEWALRPSPIPINFGLSVLNNEVTCASTYIIRIL